MMKRGPRPPGTRHENPITDLERDEMQAMRNSGFSQSYIALAFDCGSSTVGQNTVSPPKKVDIAKRNAEILRRYDGADHEEREFLARHYGFASLKSLVVVMSLYRRSLRLKRRAASTPPRIETGASA